jgi:hypothetical protein
MSLQWVPDIPETQGQKSLGKLFGFNPHTRSGFSYISSGCLFSPAWTHFQSRELTPAPGSQLHPWLPPTIGNFFLLLAEI